MGFVRAILIGSRLMQLSSGSQADPESMALRQHFTEYHIYNLGNLGGIHLYDNSQIAAFVWLGRWVHYVHHSPCVQRDAAFLFSFEFSSVCWDIKDQKHFRHPFNNSIVGTLRTSPPVRPTQLITLLQQVQPVLLLLVDAVFLFSCSRTEQIGYCTVRVWGLGFRVNPKPSKP